MQEANSIFLSQHIILFESSTNFLPPSLKDTSVFFIVVAFFITWLVSWLPLAAITGLAIKWKPSKPLQSEQKIPLLVSLYLLAPLILWGVSALTNTPFSNYGLFRNISILNSLLLGLVLGVGSIAVIFSCQMWLGWCSLQKSIKLALPIVLPILLVALFVGGIEELVFRGFLFTALNKDYPVWVAAVISSLIFAVLHLIWEQQETIPQLPGLWFMGMVLVLARFTDGGSIGLAWGLHTGWVWSIACLDTAQLINYTGKVSDWVTGKNQKPLAGITGNVCLLLTGAVLWLMSRYL